MAIKNAPRDFGWNTPITPGQLEWWISSRPEVRFADVPAPTLRTTDVWAKVWEQGSVSLFRTEGRGDWRVDLHGTTVLYCGEGYSETEMIRKARAYL